jgi:hypothetical protein
MPFDLSSAVPVDPNQGVAPVLVPGAAGGAPVVAVQPAAVPAAAPQLAQGGFDLASAVPIAPQGQQPAGAPVAAAPGFLDRLRLPNEDPNSIENTIRRSFGAPAVGKNPEFEKVANADSPFPDVLPTSPNALKDLASAVGTPIKYLLRGGEANIPKVAGAVEDAAKAGTTLSAGQATGNRAVQAGESFLSKYPGSAGVMAKKAESEASDIGAKAEKIADTLSPTATPSVAGRTIEKGLTGPGGFLDRFKQGQKALYGKLDEYIKPQTPVAVSNTSKALASMNEDIEGAEALSKFFKNGKIQDIEAALKSDTAGTKAGVLVVPPNATTAEQRAAASHGLLRRQAPEVREGQAPLAGKVSGARNPYTRATREAVPAAGTPPNVSIQPGTSAVPSYASGQRVPIPGGSPTNELPYEALKKLRTLVGNEISDSNMASSVPRSKWKALYGALSSDLDAAAKSTGNSDAIKAMQRANQFTRAGHARIDDVLDSVAKKGAEPEKLFKAATNTEDMQAGATKIASVMKSLQPAERDVVKSAFVRRMGTAAAGQQGAEGGKFSTQTFLTNWVKMSPQAKSVMFSSADGNLRSSLDSIARTAENIKEGGKVFANPSGSGQIVAASSLASSIAGTASTGHLGAAAALIGTTPAAYLTAKLMTNQRFVGWLARASKGATPETARQAVLLLGKSMQGEPADVREDAEAYAQAAAQNMTTAAPPP